jgi:sensor histidine kinase regulating citrate/malate metabolism
VKDNGLGIDLVKFGNKIFKLNQTFHSHENSRGVGLYITKAQVESFGGNIEVKSRENEGSEFIVTL